MLPPHQWASGFSQRPPLSDTPSTKTSSLALVASTALPARSAASFQSLLMSPVPQKAPLPPVLCGSFFRSMAKTLGTLR